MFSEIIKQMLSQDNENQIKLALEIIRKDYPQNSMVLKYIELLLNKKYRLSREADFTFQLVKLNGIYSQISHSGYKHKYDIDNFTLKTLIEALNNVK